MNRNNKKQGQIHWGEHPPPSPTTPPMEFELNVSFKQCLAQKKKIFYFCK